MIVRMLAMLFATYDVLIVQARHLSEQRQLELSNTRGLRAVHSPPRLHELMRSHAGAAPLVLNKHVRNATVLFLPDYKQTGADLASKTQELTSKLHDSKGGPSWLDVNTASHHRHAPPLDAAARVVEELIKSEVKQGTPENKIILAGVGQGGAVALGMLRYLKQVSGIIGISAFLPSPRAQSIITDDMLKVPVFLMHGTGDFSVQKNWTMHGYHALKHAGANVGRIEYTDLGHQLFENSNSNSSGQQVLQDLGDMINEMLFASEHNMELLMSHSGTRNAESVAPVAADTFEPLTLDNFAPMPARTAHSRPHPHGSTLPAADILELNAENLSLHDSDGSVAPAESPESSDAEAFGPEDAQNPSFCEKSEECQAQGTMCYQGQCMPQAEVGQRCVFNGDCASGHCEVPNFKCAPKIESGEKCMSDEACLSNECIWEWCWDLSKLKVCK